MQSYRGWKVEGGWLRSYSHDMLWKTTTVTATCDHGCKVSDCLEHHDCSCGIYSRKDLKHLLKEYNSMDIYGSIYNHGVVVEGATGFRAEKVTILSLFTADFALGKILAKNYPGVAIMFPPEEVIKAQRQVFHEDDYQARWQRARQRAIERVNAVAMAKIKFPLGPEAEKQRLMALLKGANREKIIEFAKEYASTDEWAARLWQGHIEKRTKKAKPGDMVFEANDDTHPYIFIGSTRPNPHASMRYLFDRNGILVKRPNIRRWDEEPELMEARRQAIEEWS